MICRFRKNRNIYKTIKMKIVANTKSGYLIDVSYGELNMITNGNPYPQSDIECKKSGETCVYRLETGVEIDINGVYERIGGIRNFKTTGYDSARYQIEKLLEALEPIEEFFKQEKEKLYPDSK